MPEEIKGLLRVIVQEQAETRTLIQDLDADVKSLSKRYHRSVVERYAVIVVLLTSIALVSLFIVDALQRRAEFRGELRDLACLAVKRTAPGVSETVDDLRNRYNCPPFVAAAVTTLPTSTATVTAPARPRATVTKPGSSRTVVLPGPTASVTRTVQARPRTLVRTVTATRTVARCQFPLLPCQKGK